MSDRRKPFVQKCKHGSVARLCPKCGPLFAASPPLPMWMLIGNQAVPTIYINREKS